ncbi:MAG: undecaprenyl-diphosphate phosphatase [Actinomycetes bacterium]
MPIIHAIVLGLIQGLTEFLPVSSSGHLLLAPWLMGWNDFSDVSVEKAFDVALHLGTLIAVVGYFRHDLVKYIRDGLRMVFQRQRPSTPEGRLAWLLVVASIPAALFGAVFENWVDEHLGKPAIIGVSLMVFAVVLAWADRRRGERNFSEMTRRDAGLIGMAQVLALNPGTSRSGISISAARLLGFDRDSAVRFSFLLSIPVTAGAVLLKLAKLLKDGVPDGLAMPMLVGVVTAGVAGWLAVAGLLRLIKTQTFNAFVIYRLAAGVAVVVIAASAWR